ncbi:hypothetical protein H4S08_003375 [Coemansia sp. RSA 1365]|nr:hypothetical protein H4S08_003375 [Coemansia sp. RSA 1365]
MSRCVCYKPRKGRQGKFKESAYIDHQRMDSRVAHDLRQKFGLNPMLILGKLVCGNGRVADSVTDQSCLRIIKRDLVACLNFRHIVDGLREHGSVPERFMRPRRADNVPAAIPDGGPPVQHRRTE